MRINEHCVHESVQMKLIEIKKTQSFAYVY
jgi:hypothetical protein